MHKILFKKLVTYPRAIAAFRKFQANFRGFQISSEDLEIWASGEWGWILKLGILQVVWNSTLAGNLFLRINPALCDLGLTSSVYLK